MDIKKFFLLIFVYYLLQSCSIRQKSKLQKLLLKCPVFNRHRKQLNTLITIITDTTSLFDRNYVIHLLERNVATFISISLHLFESKVVALSESILMQPASF